ncbi:unnamed protein product [Penicillium bialowiezense]
MKIPSPKAIDEVAKVVWASHILSYWNPYTTPESDKPLQPKHTPSDDEITDDDEDYDDSPDTDNTSTDTAVLAVSDEALREKFLNSISELLAHTKGGKHVTAAALREKEDSIEIDIARNTGFGREDNNFLSSLARFLSRQGERFSHQNSVDNHEFLRETIVYNASRVNDGVEKAAQLLKKSPLRPITRSSSESQSKDLTCLLGCCSKTHPLASNAIESLLPELLNFYLLKSNSSALLGRENQMCQIVELAALALRSSHKSHSKLKDMLPCADIIKVMKRLRSLARLVTDLHVLSHIARLLPSFRSVIFIKVSPPDPVRLQKRHKQTVHQAWKKLQLQATGEGLPNVVAEKGSQFKSDCSHTPTVHCEIQLLARYEAEPSLTPTLLYLGCSKKACFLYTDKIGVWFPRDTKEPELVWVPIISKLNEYHADFDAFLGPKHSVLFTLPFNENKRRGLVLDHQITIYYQDWDERPTKTNQSIQHAVEACHGMRVPYNLCGDYVAMSGRQGDPSSEYLDIDCADFRHILDYFSTYFDETIRETTSGGSVRAVQISCPLEQKLKSCEQFQSVVVDRDFPSTKMVSGLSMAFEDPMWICQINSDELKDGIMLLDELPEDAWRNLHAEHLAIDLDAESDNWGMSSRSPWRLDGSIIVMRRYGKDLDVEWVQHICAYYLKVLQPLFARALSGDISREDVLAEVTRERIMAWISVVAPGGSMNLEPHRGSVKSM